MKKWVLFLIIAVFLFFGFTVKNINSDGSNIVSKIFLSYWADTADFSGTFDGQEGSYYLYRANHTGTQSVSTLSDLGSWAGSTNITILGTIGTGTWQGTAIGDSYLTKTGDWTGTFDGQEGSYYLARTNHTGTSDTTSIDRNQLITFIQNNQTSLVSDGDKGDVVVSSSGAAWNLDNNFISTKPPSIGNAVLTGDSIIIERSGVLYSSSVDEVRDFVQLNIADDVAYSSAWDSDGDATSKNTLYDKFEDLKNTGIPRTYNTITTAFDFTDATVNVFNGSSTQTLYLPALSSVDDGVEYVITNLSVLYDLNIKPAGSDEISGFDNTERQIKLLDPGNCCTIKKVSSTQWAIISLFGQFN